MATAVVKSVYPHITKNPKVMAGRACIEGTRIRVMDIANLHEAGYTPEKMLEEYPQLDLIKIYAALVYYHDHRAEIEACFAESQKWAASNERERLEYLRKRSNR
ncbi:MAG TPA: DUF433 domain-containing protein [Vicinamibacteria bacterium]|jgi:uncharacterized protein (DUF433 family)